MRRIDHIFIMLLIISLSTLTISCSESEKSETGKDSSLFLTIKVGGAVTSRSTDNLALGNDSQFSSLALYVFNKSDGYCEYSELIPNIASATNEFYRSVQVSSQTKMVYAIANYVGSDKTLSATLSNSTTMAELEAMTVTNASYISDNVMMIGKQEVEITGTSVQANIPMERLTARVDIYMFKNQSLLNDNVNVISIELLNQVLNSNSSYQNQSMMNPINKQNVAGTIDNSKKTLQTMDENSVTELIPSNAHASFYSYQNIAAQGATPDSSVVTPYLRATIEINGNTYVYGAYITDAGQTTNKYSLMRNNVYRVIAMFTHPDNELILQITTSPWEVTESQTGGTTTDLSYTFTALNGNDNGALTGIVQYPYILNSVSYNETSYANYVFTMTAPAGKIWTASLTNGLDFGFSSRPTASGGISVSQGITRSNPYQISVGATKSWGGANKNTYMYITVDGMKLKINPLGSDNTRKFPGSNDTDILISQTQYK